MKTLYYTDSSWVAYTSKEACEAAEKKEKEDNERWAKAYQDNDPEIQLEKLIRDLKNSVVIAPMTIATCSYRALQMKGLTKVCKDFYEANKASLNYY